jgi:hypothetical protein
LWGVRFDKGELMLVLLFMACTFPSPDCANGYDRNDEEQCIRAPSVSTDTGGTALLGTYQGDISIEVDADVPDIEVQDVCAGSVAFELNDGVLDGAVQCTFAGTVASLIGSDPFDGTLTGTVSADGNTTGQIVLDLATFGVLDEEWSGTTTAEQIEGSFTGEMTFNVGALEVPVLFDGQFEATP